MTFKVINESFICGKCGADNPPAPETCRNHCRKCLWSKHVDDKSPGDRQSDCGGLMRPMQIIGSIDNLSVVHHCMKCGKEMRNKVAKDDNYIQFNM